MGLLTLPPCSREEILARDVAPGDGCRDALKPWVLALTVAGSSLTMLVLGGVNVSLPAMQRELDADVGQAQWLLNGYLLTLAAFTLPMGAAGDRFGRRRVFLVGLGVFAVASLLCGLAPSTGGLIAARLLQGLGASMLVPTSLALLAATFPREERGRAIGTWGAASALTMALGPPLAGAITQFFGWHWVFLSVVPFAAATWLLAWRILPGSRDPDAPPVDLLGGVLASAALGTLTFGLIRGNHGWWAPDTLAGLIGGTTLLAAFLVHQTLRQRGERGGGCPPMMPPRLFRDPTFAAANALTFTLYFGLMSMFFLMPFRLEGVMRFQTWQVGLAFLPFSVLMATLSRYAGGLADRIGPRPLLTLGPLITAAGFLALGWTGTDPSYVTAVLPGLLLIGLGMAATVSPLTTTVMNAVPERQAGVASGVNNTLARVASLMSVAVVGTLVALVFRGRLEDALAGARIDTDLAAAVLAQADRLALVDTAAAPLLRPDVDAAFADAFFGAMVLAAACAVVCTGLAWFVLRPPKPSRPG